MMGTIFADQLLRRDVPAFGNSDRLESKRKEVDHEYNLSENQSLKRHIREMNLRYGPMTGLSNDGSHWESSLWKVI